MSNKILYFTADWCCACKCVSPLVTEYGCTKINVDEDEDNLCAKYNVRNLPTILIVDSEGKEIKRHTGSLTKGELESFINE